MKIVLDAMGSDAHPVPDVAGAVLAAREFNLAIILVGDESRLKPELAKHDTRGLDLSIAHASTAIGMTEHVEAIKEKKDASMNIGMKLVKEKQADAFVTAGNTGAAMAAAIVGPYALGRIRGIKRPALTAALPTATGRTLCLDIGANADVKPEYLYQFAIMGSLYAERCLGIQKPRVGLLSNGEEEGKGPMVVREAYAMLKSASDQFLRQRRRARYSRRHIRCRRVRWLRRQCRDQTQRITRQDIDEFHQRRNQETTHCDCRRGAGKTGVRRAQKTTRSIGVWRRHFARRRWRGHHRARTLGCKGN